MKSWKLGEGSIARNRKYQKAYNAYRSGNPALGCQFCDFVNGGEQIQRTFQHFWVVINIFPYYIWDSSRVLEHLMLVPKRHVDSIADFDHDERLEYVAIMMEYESSGYNIYSRTHASGQKSVAHQHTHFIKIGKQISSQVFLNKPHVNIVR